MLRRCLVGSSTLGGAWRESFRAIGRGGEGTVSHPIRSLLTTTRRFQCSLEDIGDTPPPTLPTYKARRVPSTVPRPKPSQKTLRDISLVEEPMLVMPATSVPHLREDHVAKDSPPIPGETPLQRRMRLARQRDVFRVTPAAAVRLKELMMLSPAGSDSIRVSVKRRGCSGYSYVMDYENEEQVRQSIKASGKKRVNDDARVVQDGVVVVVDGDALFYVVGTELDFVCSKLLEERFVFKNPNTKGQCGCGESFLI